MIVCACLVLGAVLALALILIRGGSARAANVTLGFVGFTNQVLVSVNAGASNKSGLIRANNIALVLAKNTGSVPVELFGFSSPTAFSISSIVSGGPAPVIGPGLPRLLKPGESIVIPAMIMRKGAAWSVELCYQRRAWRERFVISLLNARVPFVRSTAKRIFTSQYEFVPVHLGPLTNQPPWGLPPPVVEK